MDGKVGRELGGDWTIVKSVGLAGISLHRRRIEEAIIEVAGMLGMVKMQEEAELARRAPNEKRCQKPPDSKRATWRSLLAYRIFR